jgi:TolB protein
MKSINFILMLLLALLIASCSPSATHENKENVTGSCKIVYNVWYDQEADDYEVFIMDVDGKNPTNITHHKDVAWTYLAGKNKVYFISDRDTAHRNYFLYEMKPDGSEVRKISDLRLEDSWMDTRNNEKEMVVSGRIGKTIRSQLFIIDIASGSYRQITNDTAAFFRDPLFSPDGIQVVCAYQANKRDKNQHEELYIMNTDGSGMKQLTHYPENDTLIRSYGYKAGPPRWHPTENFISYMSKQAGKYSLYAVTPDGNRQWKLTENTIMEGWHDWSPDGKWLVFDSGNDDDSFYHIMLMNWETKAVTQLTDTTYHYHQAPAFVEIN